jgi:hypothetical protein
MEIQKFESFNSNIFIKDYGQKYPLSELKKGDQVLYRGATYTVVKPDSFAVEMVNKDGERNLINQSMFNEFGAIRKN